MALTDKQKETISNFLNNGQIVNGNDFSGSNSKFKIDASDIRAILTNPKTLVLPRAKLHFVNIHFEGRLDLDGLSTDTGRPFPPLRFSDCTFEGGFSIANASLMGIRMDSIEFIDIKNERVPSLCLTATTIVGHFSLADISSKPRQDGDASMLWIKADNSKIGGDFFIKNATLECPARDTNSQLHGRVPYGLELRNSTIAGDFSGMEGLVVRGGISLSGSLIKGDIWLFGAQVSSKLTASLFAQGLQVLGNVVIHPNKENPSEKNTEKSNAHNTNKISESIFKGQVNFHGATVKGSIVILGTHILKAINAENGANGEDVEAKPGNLFLYRANVSNGLVVERWENIDSTIEEGVEFNKSHIGGSLQVLSASVGSQQRVSLRGEDSTIKGDLQFINSNFEGDILLNDCHISGNAEFLNINIGTRYREACNNLGRAVLNLSDAVVDGNLLTERRGYNKTRIMGSCTSTSSKSESESNKSPCGGLFKAPGLKVKGKINLSFQRRLFEKKDRFHPTTINIENTQCAKILRINADLGLPEDLKKPWSLNAAGVDVNKDFVLKINVPSGSQVLLRNSKVGGDLDLSKLIFSTDPNDPNATSTNSSLIDMQGIKVSNGLKVKFERFNTENPFDIKNAWRKAFHFNPNNAYILMEIQWEDQTWFASFVQYLDENKPTLKLVNGESAFINEFCAKSNVMSAITKGDTTSATEYLKLYSSSIWGGERGRDGPYAIVENCDYLPWDKISDDRLIAYNESNKVTAELEIAGQYADHKKQDISKTINKIQESIKPIQILKIQVIIDFIATISSKTESQLKSKILSSETLESLKVFMSNIDPSSQDETANIEQYLQSIRDLELWKISERKLYLSENNKGFCEEHLFVCFVRHKNILYRTYFKISSNGSISRLKDIHVIEFNNAVAPSNVTPLRKYDVNFTRKSFFLNQEVEDKDLLEPQDDICKQARVLLKEEARKVNYGFVDAEIDLRHAYADRLEDDDGKAWGSDIKRLFIKNFVYASFSTFSLKESSQEGLLKRSLIVADRVEQRQKWLKLQNELSETFEWSWEAIKPRVFNFVRKLLKSKTKYDLKIRTFDVNNFETQPHSQVIKTFKQEGVGRLVKPIIKEKRKFSGAIASKASLNKAYSHLNSSKQQESAFHMILGIKDFLLAITRWVLNKLYGWVSSYGLSPMKTFLFIVAFIVFGGLVVDNANQRGIMIVNTLSTANLSQTNLDIGMTKLDYKNKFDYISSVDLLCKNLIQPSLYAADIFIPLVDFDQEERCIFRPLNTYCKEPSVCDVDEKVLNNPQIWHWFRAIYPMLGWVMISLFIFTISSTLRSEEIDYLDK